MNYVSLNKLVKDTQLLIASLPRQEITGVIGIPKSGMLPASIIACELRVPLAQLGGSFWKNEPAKGAILLVDDSAATGGQMDRAFNSIVLPEGCKLMTAVVYTSAFPKDFNRMVDFSQEIVHRPRIFEWNIWSHRKIWYTMVDLDGVLCLDPPVPDDDGPAYEEAIRNAVLLHVPKYEIFGIATGRLERWRGITEEWLKKNGILYRSLHMSQHATAMERRRARDVPSMKAKAYTESGAKLFIESEDRQAKRICAESNKPVLSLSTGIIYSPPESGIMLA